MAIEKVREYLKQYGREKDIREFDASSATVELAAEAVGVEPARIAKTLSFCGREEGSCIANPPRTKVYLDESMKRFQTVFPAAGSAHSAIELTCQELFQLSEAVEWVDVCKEI